MERLGDILQKNPLNTLKTNTAASSDTEADAVPSCPHCHGAGFVYAAVPPGHPDRGKVVPCRCTVQRWQEERRARLERYSNLGPLARLTFDNLIPGGKGEGAADQERFTRAVELARAYGRQPEGWLVLVGPPGCGKTHLAAAIANHRLAQGESALFIIVPELLDHLRSTYGPESDISYDELFQQVKDAPFLVMDDLGSQTSSHWAQEKLHQLINHRYNEQRPTVFTLALPLEEMEARLRLRLEDPRLSQVVVMGEGRPSLPLGMESGLRFLRSMTFESFDPQRADLTPEQRQNLVDAFSRAREFAQSPSGWLVFQGDNGCGKTHLAAAIANYRLGLGGPVIFVSVPELLDHLRSSFSPQSPLSYDELFERVKEAPLLILDDFGEQSSTPWAQDKLYQLISYRYNARLPTVITTCLRLESIERRIASRLVDARVCMMFWILAPSYRGDLAAEEKPPSRGRYPRRLRP